MMQHSILLMEMYEAMLTAMGPSGWWPADSAFEVSVGAILTQNTNWGNVEKALDNLKKADALTPSKMAALPPAELAEHIRPSGFYKVKAGRLRNFLTFLKEEADYDLEALASYDSFSLREMLLDVKGIGPETADSILLYAFEKPSFVVDAYTKRILNRHALIPEQTHYDEMRDLFMGALEPDQAIYNEYHALIVRIAKEYCKPKNPLCEQCPLEPFLER